jgi:hypothetical protein
MHTIEARDPLHIVPILKAVRHKTDEHGFVTVRGCRYFFIRPRFYNWKGDAQSVGLLVIPAFQTEEAHDARARALDILKRRHTLAPVARVIPRPILQAPLQVPPKCVAHVHVPIPRGAELQ